MLYEVEGLNAAAADFYYFAGFFGYTILERIERRNEAGSFLTLRRQRVLLDALRDFDLEGRIPAAEDSRTVADRLRRAGWEAPVEQDGRSVLAADGRLIDAWGNELRFAPSPEGIVIRSAGRNGVDEHGDGDDIWLPPHLVPR